MSMMAKRIVAATAMLPANTNVESRAFAERRPNSQAQTAQGMGAQNHQAGKAKTSLDAAGMCSLPNASITKPPSAAPAKHSIRSARVSSHRNHFKAPTMANDPQQRPRATGVVCKQGGIAGSADCGG